MEFGGGRDKHHWFFEKLPRRRIRRQTRLEIRARNAGNKVSKFSKGSAGRKPQK